MAIGYSFFYCPSRNMSVILEVKIYLPKILFHPLPEIHLQLNLGFG